MNILYVTHSPIIGGAEISLLAHIRKVDKQKYTITLVCSELLLPYAQDIQGITIIPMQFYLLHRLNPLVLVRYLIMVWSLIRIIQGKHIDIVHTNSVKAHYVGSIASLLTGKRCFLWMRDDTMNHFLFNIVRHVVYRIIFISAYIESIFGKSANTCVVHNGTEIYIQQISKEERLLLRRKYASDDMPILLCTERLVHWKGVHILLEALAQLTNNKYVCLIIGSGKEQRDNAEESLYALQKNLGLNDTVNFLGWRNDIAQFYQIADIFIHPVITPEPFGLVVIEAMAFGLPVIATDLGGPKEIITQGKNGILITPNDSSALAKQITYLLKSPQERKRIGENAQSTVMQTFTQEYETSQICTLYDQSITE